MSDHVAVVVPITLFVKVLFEFLETVSVSRVHLEQFLHHRRLFFVQYQFFIALAVPEDTAVPKDDARLDCLLMPEFDAGGEFAEFILRDGGHDGQTQFAVEVGGVDVVVLKVYAHTVSEQEPRVLQGIHRVAGKTGNLFGDDEVEHPRFRILDHREKPLAVLDGDRGDPLVHITGDEGPCLVLPDQILIVVDLVFERVELL